MQWLDEGVIITIKPLGESGAYVAVFTKHHGLCSGYIRRQALKGRTVGTMVHVRWQGRLEEQLGFWHFEDIISFSALTFSFAEGLWALHSVATLLGKIPPEGHSYLRVYDALSHLLHSFEKKEKLSLGNAYLLFERTLLEDMGFGLDLSKCVKTKKKENLIYVSPKSGKAVSAEAGYPYAEKLLKLPDFILNRSGAQTPYEIFEGMRLIGYFITKHLLDPHGWVLPLAREQLMQKYNLSSSA